MGDLEAIGGSHVAVQNTISIKVRGQPSRQRGRTARHRRLARDRDAGRGNLLPTKSTVMTHGALTSHCSDEADRREPGKCRWIANLHQLHGWGRSVSQIVELPHVEHVGKSRFSILGRLGLACRFICARRRRRRWARRRLGRNGTFRGSPTKRWSDWRRGKSGDRSERNRKCQ